MTSIQFLSLVDVYARLELKAEASKFYLYYVWWFLEPLLFVGVFYVVFKLLLAVPKENFLLFLICGKIPFFWFSKAVNEASHSLVTNRGIIAQIAVPKLVFPHALVLGNSYKQLFVFPLLFVISMSYGYQPAIGWLWIGPIMLIQMLLIQVCGLMAALLVSFVEDFRPLVQLGTMFLMFCSGVFWDLDAIQNETLRQWLLDLNPLAFLIHSYRIVLMGDQMVDVSHLAALGAVCCVSLFGVHRLYARLDTAIARNVI